MESNIENILLDYFSGHATIEKLADIPATFKVTDSDGIWFVKDFSDYPCVEDFIDYDRLLFEKGVNKSAPWMEVFKSEEWHFLKRLFSFEVVTEITVNDFQLLLNEVKKIHEVGKEFKPSEKLKQVIEDHFTSLEVAKNSVLNKKYTEYYNSEITKWLDENHEWLVSAISEYPGAYNQSEQSCFQHGDLHLGNILQEQGQLYLIDFEEFYKSYDSPLYDLSSLYVRFYLPLKGKIKRCPFEENEDELIEAAKSYSLRLIFTVLSNSIFRAKSKGNWLAELNKFRLRFDQL